MIDSGFSPCPLFILHSHLCPTSVVFLRPMGLRLHGFQLDVICNYKEWSLFLSLAWLRFGVVTESRYSGTVSTTAKPECLYHKFRSSAFRLWQIFWAASNSPSRWLKPSFSPSISNIPCSLKVLPEHRPFLTIVHSCNWSSGKQLEILTADAKNGFTRIKVCDQDYTRTAGDI